MRSFAVTKIPELVRWGRTAESDEGASLSLFWTASGVELLCRASDLILEVEALYGGLELWADVLIDGELSQRIRLPKGVSRIPVFTGMDGTKTRRVRFLRDTQAMPGDAVSVLKIRSLETDDGAEFLPVPAPALRLEIIGDSLTSGEGAGLEKQEEWVPAVFSAVESYAYETAELLDARVNVISNSGWGLYASYDANTECAIPLYYNEVCGLLKGEANAGAGAQRDWDFGAYETDVIVVNLGTNDSGAIKASDNWTKEEYHALFIETGVSFLKTLLSRNPHAQILWAYGMLDHELEPQILSAIEQVKRETGENRVHYCSLLQCDAPLLGARFHPNREAHRQTAALLAREIRGIAAV